MSLPFPAARKWTGGSSGGGGGSVAGRVRVVNRHFQNDLGWFAWHGVSDLDATSYVKRGVATQFARRCDGYRAQARTVVRTCGMLAWPGYDYSPLDSQYWSWLDDTYKIITSRNMYHELCCFADAQIIVTDKNKRKDWMRQFGAFIRDRPGIIPQVCNEPFKNGWTGALDPDLLELAEILASEIGHRDFSIGDPQDGDNPDASAETTRACIELSRHSNIVVIHPDRGQHGDTTRYRRWVDHLEGFFDVISQLQTGATIVLDEIMGAGPTYQDGRRDNDPDMFVAAQVVGLCTGLGITYHWIVEEGLDAMNLPGMAFDPLIAIPVSPDWSYRNDSWNGAPTNGITWTGKAGKVRSLVSGNKAWTVAYGEKESDFDTVVWRPGYAPTVRYRGPHARVWSVNQ